MASTPTAEPQEATIPTSEEAMGTGDLNDLVYFTKADEIEEDDGLPPWLDGDTLAPPCGSMMDVVSELVSLAHLSSSDTILDLGCGDGRVCIHATLHHGCRSWGVDIDSKEVEKFRAAAKHFGLAAEQCKVGAFTALRFRLRLYLCVV
jgi:SAM-dependent methyltransferase